MSRSTLLPLICLLAPGTVLAQQVADSSYNPVIAMPAYESGTGPTVLIDEAHHNFHTAGGRYLSFANLLRRDGYIVLPSTEAFTRDALADADILVISNALAEENVEDWSLPTHSAFDSSEIAAVRDWVADGGALMLIADHMPMPGAALELAAAFGVHFSDGFAWDTERGVGTLVFRRSDGSLVDHPITGGRNADEMVDSVVTFAGQAFRIVVEAEPLMVVPSGVTLLMPVEAWHFSEETPHLSAEGMLQGAVMCHGEGRLALFGEAAMFSAQLGGEERRPMGMNEATAAQNYQFLLNVVHWLSGLLD